jgi:hypothetical protein
LKNGWIPIWTDGKGWQFWRDDEFLATVSVGRGERGVVYAPRFRKQTLKFATFGQAVAWAKNWLSYV